MACDRVAGRRQVNEWQKKHRALMTREQIVGLCTSHGAFIHHLQHFLAQETRQLVCTKQAKSWLKQTSPRSDPVRGGAVNIHFSARSASRHSTYCLIED